MSKNISNKEIFKAIHRSQHCQRNWDLEKKIPNEDLELLIEAATQCPSKQNISFYRTHFITNRDMIEKIYSYTTGAVLGMGAPGPEDGYNPNGIAVKNPQVLANLLIVFERKTLDEIDSKDEGEPRNAETYKKEMGIDDEDAIRDVERDANVALGIAAGYVNLTASLLGYSTGCCQCMEPAGIKEALNLKNNPLLLMGVGFKNEKINRKVHHADHNIVFGTNKKQKMELTVIE